MFVQKEFSGSFPIQKLSAVYTTYKSDRGFFFSSHKSQLYSETFWSVAL